eukprot:TRINITY_DN13141_c0_g1_i3.p1 TRINITY_DN13141_c0_g1~~TRINITY_DN13141_c0_g1_i3.p1  ORF type:complete len:580 (-),score=155.85 TRINITY_DN13141_c0_g1_i3:93-1832(-)
MRPLAMRTLLLWLLGGPAAWLEAFETAEPTPAVGWTDGLAGVGGFEAALKTILKAAATSVQGAASTTPETRAGAVYLEVNYNPSMQPTVKVSVGGQWLDLVIDASSGNTVVFAADVGGCTPSATTRCYAMADALKRGSAHICSENNQNKECRTGLGATYACKPPYMDAAGLVGTKAQPDELAIDGVTYGQDGIEAVDDVALALGGGNESFRRSGMAVRVTKVPMYVKGFIAAQVNPKLFRGTGGILGASGPSLGCRNETIWSALLRDEEVKFIAFEFQPPVQSIFSGGGAASRVVLNGGRRADFAWSEPKQTGDVVNDGMHEFLLFNPRLCGVDLLYNTSSNWLAVIDTSGTCLTVPPFLFDRIVTHAPVDCPFEAGEASGGRLCRPRRGGAGASGSSTSAATLPVLSFALADEQDPSPARLSLPLERLVFRGSDGAEYLCVARSDNDVLLNTADMMYSHIAFGSLVLAALYTAVDLENRTVGIATKGDPATEGTDGFCAARVSCVSSMQTYFPPLNMCEDPDCSEYMLMTLDESTRTCRWGPLVPFLFSTVVLGLVMLDLLSHRLYKQAIRKADEMGR